MKVLIGTTDPSKVGRFREFLPDSGIEFVTLGDLDITAGPEETGMDPQENARIKAAFYGQFCDRVICNDSGLYFEGLPMDDPRQPGLHIRSPRGQRLDDEQGKAAAFYMVDQPSKERHPGWPLDPLSVNRNTGTYFTEHGNNIYDDVQEQIMVGQYRKRIVEFVKQALGLEQ